MNRIDIDKKISKAYQTYITRFNELKRKNRGMGFDVEKYQGLSIAEFFDRAHDALSKQIKEEGKRLFVDIKMTEKNLDHRIQVVVNKAIRDDFADYTEKQEEGIKKRIGEINKEYGVDFSFEEFQKPGFVVSERGQQFYSLCMEKYHTERANGATSYEAAAAVSQMFFGSD